MKSLAVVFLLMTMLGLFFALDGYLALGATTQGCVTGICSTTTGTDSKVTTFQVTSSVTTYVTTISGTVTTTTQTWNPSNTQITIQTSPAAFGIIGQSTTFTAATSPPLAGATYSWFFGDGTGSVGNPVSHIFSGKATYPVTVYVSANGPNGVYAVGQASIGFNVQCPTTGCILGTPSVLVVTVTSSYTGSGLQGASVSITNATTGASYATGTTNAGGQYAFTVGNYPNLFGNYQVTVSASGYMTQTQKVYVGSNGASLPFNLLYSTGTCIGACPQSIAGGLFGGNPYFELEAGIALAAASGIGAFLSERDEEHE